MSDPSAFPGQSTQLRIAISAVFTDVPYVGSIEGPNETHDKIDTTSNSSPLGRREFILGLTDPGEMTAPIFWHPAEETHAELQRLSLSKELASFQLFYPQYDDGDNLLDFDGYVQLSRSQAIDGAIQRELTIMISSIVEESEE